MIIVITNNQSSLLAKSFSEERNLPLHKVKNNSYIFNIKKNVNFTKVDKIIIFWGQATNPDSSFIQLHFLLSQLNTLNFPNIYLIIPWLAYALQDNLYRAGESFGAKVVCDVLNKHKLKEITLIEPHDYILAKLLRHKTKIVKLDTIFFDYLKELNKESKFILASLDKGREKIVDKLAKKLNVKTITLEKQRDINSGKITYPSLKSANHEKIVLVDDGILTGSSMQKAIALFDEKVFKILCVHSVFLAESKSFLKNNINKLVVTNTIKNKLILNKRNTNLKTINISNLLTI